ncbi:hypothetical protein KVL09_00295 [Helicobacter pylori]|nr:hypothetical protein KVL09_00295 [Helicobacter pylori]
MRDLADRLKKLEDKLEDFEPLRKLSHFIGSFFSLGKFSNDTQENSKDALKFKNFHEKYTEPTETTELVEKIKVLSTERDKLIASYQDKSDLDLDNRLLASANQDLKRQNRKLEEENIKLKEEAYGLNEQLFTLQPQKPQ